jgi:hypothetical protein
MMIEGKQDFDNFEKDVFVAIQTRHRYRYGLKPTANTTWSREPPQYEPIPPEVTGIDVSRWLFDELRVRFQNDNHTIFIDHCDGIGPRPRWFGLPCHPADNLNGMQARLTP